MIVKYISFLLLFICISTLNSFSQTDNDSLINEMRDFITKKMKRSKVAGISIAVVDNQQIIWSEGFGYADKENKIKATDSTIYRVGSVSKLFTATAVMQLSDRGKINIDNEVSNYIEDFSIKSRYNDTITIRHLLTHHSGLPSSIFKDFFCDEQVPFNTIVHDLNKEYTCQPADYILSYSNPAFTLLGCLVEEGSNEDFYNYTEKHLFIPMEMKNSSFVLTDEMKDMYAMGYDRKGNAFEEPYIRDVPAGLMHSNVLDLSRFIMMTFNDGKYGEDQIIKPETLKEMQTPQNLDCELDISQRIGLCWFLSNEYDKWSYAGGIAEHGGDTYVYHAELVTVPEQKLGVVVLTNSYSGATVIREIANQLLEEFLEENRGLLKPEDKEAAKVKLDKKSRTDYSDICGDYSLLNLYFPVYQKGKTLMTKQNSLKLALVPNNKGSFTPQIRVSGIIRIPVKSQQLSFIEIDSVKYIAIISGTDSVVIGKKFDKLAYDEIWQSRLGKYVITNDSNTFRLLNNVEIKEEYGLLTMAGKVFSGSRMKFLLQPVSKTEAIIVGIGRETGYTVTFIDDRFYFSGLEFKKDTD